MPRSQQARQHRPRSLLRVVRLPKPLHLTHQVLKLYRPVDLTGEFQKRGRVRPTIEEDFLAGHVGQQFEKLAVFRVLKQCAVEYPAFRAAGRAARSPSSTQSALGAAPTALPMLYF